jgi:uncharacterized protein YggE
MFSESGAGSRPHEAEMETSMTLSVLHARGHVACATAFAALAVSVLIGVAPVGIASAEPVVAQGAVATQGISVTGESTVTVAPDVAYLRVGVQTSARTAREAGRTNATQVAAVIDAVTRAGIPSSAIRTVGLSLRPTYATRNQPDNRPPTIVGYEATNQIEVTISTVAIAGEVVDAAIDAGANVVGNLRFAVKDDAAVVAQALNQAGADARARADAIAAGIGTRVTGILSASDDAGGVVRPMASDAISPRVMGAPGMASEAANSPVSPGELSYRGHVRVTFAVGG